MNLEDLNKSQLILLTVLINFVTSIATGILTVSLLDQAPPLVTQTINRIVEHTVETVAQAAPATVIQAPKPSVEDLITSAFAAGTARSILIFDPSTATTSEALAVGSYLPKARAVVTVAGATLPKEVVIGFSNGTRVPASLSHADEALAIYGFSDTATLPPAPAPALLALKDLKLGQTALALTKDGGAATGIVSKLSDGLVYTTLPDTEAGAAVLDLAGNIIGIANGAGALISADRIVTLLTAPSPQTTDTQ